MTSPAEISLALRGHARNALRYHSSTGLESSCYFSHLGVVEKLVSCQPLSSTLSPKTPVHSDRIQREDILISADNTLGQHQWKIWHWWLDTKWFSLLPSVRQTGEYTLTSTPRLVPIRGTSTQLIVAFPARSGGCLCQVWTTGGDTGECKLKPRSGAEEGSQGYVLFFGGGQGGWK